MFYPWRVADIVDQNNSNTVASGCLTQKNTVSCRVTEQMGSSKMTCRIQRLCQLQALIGEQRTNISHLDLSSNQITNIPTGTFSLYEKIISLSFACNEIRVLSYEAFYGLDYLQTLNLSMNPLHTFTGNLTDVFSSLSTLDATGIKDWKPEKQFLHLRMLKRIIGLQWSARCDFCSFHKNKTQNTTWLRPLVDFPGACYGSTYTLRKSSPVLQLVTNTSFQFSCTKHCTCLGKGSYSHTSINNCWKETLIAMIIDGCLGCVAMILNLVVFLNILTSKSLRQNVSMLFLCNMGFSDFMLGVYSFSLALYLNYSSFVTLNDHSPQHCWKIGILWLLGQAVAVVTSLFLTLERYLVIIYALRPDLWISRRLAVIMIAISWFVAIFFTGYALYFNFYFYTFLCIPVRLDFNFVHVSAFTITLGTIALSSYIISFIMYIHIYIDCRRTAQNTGIKWESKMAKRIAVLVFSNVFFFFFPIILAFGLVLYSRYNKNFTSTLSYYMIANIFPVFCLAANSILNPVLYAFRNDHFVEALHQRFLLVRERVRSLLPRQPWMPSSTRVAPENQ